jgi:hypothetical protein
MIALGKNPRQHILRERLALPGRTRIPLLRNRPIRFAVLAVEMEVAEQALAERMFASSSANSSLVSFGKNWKTSKKGPSCSTTRCTVTSPRLICVVMGVPLLFCSTAAESG